MVIINRMLKKHSFLALLMLLQLTAFNQALPDSSYTDIAAIRDSSTAVKKTLLFFDSNNVATIENITRQNFVPFTRFDNRRAIRAKLVSKLAYLQLALFNSSSVADTVYFFPGLVFNQILFYEVGTDKSLKFAGSKFWLDFPHCRKTPFENLV